LADVFLSIYSFIHRDKKDSKKVSHIDICRKNIKSKRNSQYKNLKVEACSCHFEEQQENQCSWSGIVRKKS
jgi:hypothetical protein